MEEKAEVAFVASFGVCIYFLVTFCSVDAKKKKSNETPNYKLVAVNLAASKMFAEVHFQVASKIGSEYL